MIICEILYYYIIMDRIDSISRIMKDLVPYSFRQVEKIKMYI